MIDALRDIAKRLRVGNTAWVADAEVVDAAADQLAAVRFWAHEHGGHFPAVSDLDAILNGANGGCPRCSSSCG